MLTGLASFDTALDAINSGEVYRFFTKPCDARELSAAIRVALLHRELLVQSRRLLATVRRQGEILHELESVHPGIAQLRQSADGAILIDEGSSDDLEAFLEQTCAELDRAHAA